MTSPDPEDTRRPEPSGTETGSDTTGPDPDRADTSTDTDADRGGAAPDAPDDRAVRRAELPADVDAAFAAIIADWASSDAPHWPGDDGASEPTDGRASGVSTATPPSGHRAVDPTSTPPHPREAPAPRDEHDEHFVPPEAPPLPRIGLGAVFGLVLLVGGVVLLAVPSLLGGSIGLGIVPGLLSMTAGLGWLVFGMRRPREHGDGPGTDDGAIL